MLNCKFLIESGKNDELFRVGNIYNVVNGKILAGNGRTNLPLNCYLYNNEELINYLSSKGLPNGSIWSSEGFKIKVIAGNMI